MNRKGFAEVVLLTYVIAGLMLFFVPNPVSSSLGIGIRPNKTVQTEKVELIKDTQGNPIAYKTTTSNMDIQQHVGIFEQLRSLPILFLFLMGAGTVFPPIAIFLHKAYSKMKVDTRKIVVSVDKAMSKIKDDSLKDQMYSEMAKTQDSSTKKLVDKIQGKH